MLWSQQLDLTGQVVVSPVVVNGNLFIGTSLAANTAYAATLWLLYVQAFLLHTFCRYCLFSAALIFFLNGINLMVPRRPNEA